MKKNYLFKGVLLAIPLAAFVLMSSSTGRDDARTGSPGDGGNTCAACHSGGSLGASLDITTNIPAGGYELSTSYSITVTSSSSSSDAVYGFQLTAENSSNEKVGFLIAGTGTRPTNKRITHTSPSTSGTWTFNWTSPATDQGEIKFYAASVVANNNGNTSGDEVVTASTNGFGVLGISEAKRLAFNMYPNPVVNEINVQLPTGVLEGKVAVYNHAGQLVKSQLVTSEAKTVNVQNLAQGMYILKVEADGKLGAKHFIK